MTCLIGIPGIIGGNRLWNSDLGQYHTDPAIWRSRSATVYFTCARYISLSAWCVFLEFGYTLSVYHLSSHRVRVSFLCVYVVIELMVNSKWFQISASCWIIDGYFYCNVWFGSPAQMKTKCFASFRKLCRYLRDVCGESVIMRWHESLCTLLYIFIDIAVYVSEVNSMFTRIQPVRSQHTHVQHYVFWL